MRGLLTAAGAQHACEVLTADRAWADLDLPIRVRLIRWTIPALIVTPAWCRELTAAYDRAHALIMRRGGAVSSRELRHHCATDDSSPYIVGVWESEAQIRRRWSSDEFRDTLTSVGFASPTEADISILQVHAIEPPL